jgi:hypothetical protein
LKLITGENRPMPGYQQTVDRTLLMFDPPSSISPDNPLSLLAFPAGTFSESPVFHSTKPEVS